MASYASCTFSLLIRRRCFLLSGRCTTLGKAGRTMSVGTALHCSTADSKKSQLGTGPKLAVPSTTDKRHIPLIVLGPRLGKQPCQARGLPGPRTSTPRRNIYCVRSSVRLDSTRPAWGSAVRGKRRAPALDHQPIGKEDSDPLTGSTFCDPTVWFDRDCTPARHLSHMLPVSCNSPPPSSPEISRPGLSTLGT